MTINQKFTTDKTKLFRLSNRIDSFSTASPSPYKDLTFPLNVYAHTLLLQEGKATYLHYGLFENHETDLQTAQQYSTDLLISRLPASSCRILEVGVGLGATFSLLTQQGHHVHGITPDAQQIHHIHKYLDKSATITCQYLEDFESGAKSFDVMLFQESAQYIEPLVIFNKASDLLSSSGNLLILDEFALQRVETEMERLHLLDDMIALAERFGFELVERLDLSTMAAPTLDYLLHMTAVHRKRLVQELNLSEEQLIQLDESNRNYQKKYASGHYGYGLLHFRKKSTPKWRLQRLKKDQVPEMLALFEKTFNHRMTPETWQWKYGSNPGAEICIWRENQLIAHYGGLSRKILFFGQPQTAVQIGDVIVDASERGILTKKGPFFLMAATFLERYIGYGKPYLVGFGFPNERAMKVAERHGLYAEVGHMLEFSWNAMSRIPLWGTRLHPFDHNQTEFTTTAIDECWQRMAADLQESIIGVRDWQYLQHRYLDHPSQQYQIMLVKNRFNERVRGILVLRYNPEYCEIIDIVAPLCEIPVMVIHARRLASMHGINRVLCRITENFAAHFAGTGGTQQTLNIRIPTNAWSDGPAPEILKNHWWLMSGDTDFK